MRVPSTLAPLTQRMLAASSGLSKPASAASYARRRTAANRPLIVPGASRRDSRWMRYRVTTVLLNESRGSEQYQDELIDCVTITPLRIRGTQAIEHSASRLIKIGKAELGANHNLLPPVCPLSSLHSRRPPCRYTEHRKRTPMRSKEQLAVSRQLNSEQAFPRATTRSEALS